ncbi:hypothetical protein ABS198_21930, partial [Acinetobacter baumannii]|uniref:hypothetical protein n=1 Tax=Acinetobacter baumannii TaxID=470 RepID=UPI00331CB07B
MRRARIGRLSATPDAAAAPFHDLAARACARLRQALGEDATLLDAPDAVERIARVAAISEFALATLER